jgi:hypothetical protein
LGGQLLTRRSSAQRARCGRGSPEHKPGSCGTNRVGLPIGLPRYFNRPRSRLDDPRTGGRPQRPRLVENVRQRAGRCPTRPLGSQTHREKRAELSPRAVGTVDHDFFVLFDVRVADEESLPAGRDLARFLPHSTHLRAIFARPIGLPYPMKARAIDPSPLALIAPIRAIAPAHGPPMMGGEGPAACDYEPATSPPR